MNKAAEKQYARLLDYRRVFGTPEGQRVLWDMMKNAHMLSPCFMQDKDEAIFHDGERNAVLRILTKIKTDPKKLREMIDRGYEEENKE